MPQLASGAAAVTRACGIAKGQMAFTTIIPVPCIAMYRLTLEFWSNAF